MSLWGHPLELPAGSDHFAAVAITTGEHLRTVALCAQQITRLGAGRLTG